MQLAQLFYFQFLPLADPEQRPLAKFNQSTPPS
jgi:hypothetical protein